MYSSFISPVLKLIKVTKNYEINLLVNSLALTTNNNSQPSIPRGWIQLVIAMGQSEANKLFMEFIDCWEIKYCWIWQTLCRRFYADSLSDFSFCTPGSIVAYSLLTPCSFHALIPCSLPVHSLLISFSLPTQVLLTHRSLCLGYDVKLIRCVLDMTLNSSVVSWVWR